MIRENRTAFLRSLSLELDSQSDRVRHLIGARHWLTDGSHKEGLLSSFLRQNVPAGIIIVRGFVINATEPDRSSGEQDLLLVDTTTEAPLFRTGEIGIVLPQSVVASVSVKSTFSLTTLDGVLKGLASIAEATGPDRRRAYWFGAYFFDTTGERIDLEPALDRVLAHPQLADLLMLSSELVIRASPSILLRASASNGKVAASGFRVPQLATGVFQARLAAHLARTRGREAEVEALIVDLEPVVEETVVRTKEL